MKHTPLTLPTDLQHPGLQAPLHFLVVRSNPTEECCHRRGESPFACVALALAKPRPIYLSWSQNPKSTTEREYSFQGHLFPSCQYQ
jgi:hypothetical protein